MTKVQAFELANPMMIAKMFASNADDYHLSHIKKFCSYNNELPKAVINMMIMYIIAVDSNKKPAGKLPRLESYYRITQENWISLGIKTPEAALMYYEQAIDEANNIQKYINQGTAKDNSKPRLTPSKPFIPEAIDRNISAALDSVYKRMK
jgi:hypothetical protein